MSNPSSRVHNRRSSERATRDTYTPVRNQGLVRPITTDLRADEYQRILPYVSDERKIGNRVLQIVSNAIIEMSSIDEKPQQAELIGDATFMFNALLAQRTNYQSMRELANFGSGFRGSDVPSITGSMSIKLGRPINALDYFAESASGDILIDRTWWGAGNKSSQPVMYKIMDDITVIDARNPQQY